MADLPDYYTQAQISEAEAASFKGGLEANRSLTPVSRDIYLATDTLKLFYCVVDGAWLDVTHACLLLAGGTMTGAIAMGTNKITGLGDPTLAQDAATKAYVLAGLAFCLLLTGGTMAGNIVMAGNKVTGLGAPAAQDDALRYNRLEIRNAEIAAAAAIVYSKLNLTGAIKKGDIEAAAGIEYSKLALAASIVMADFAAAIKNAANGIVVLDASADVPDAQIPNLAAGKITSDRFPVDRLPAMTDEKIWKGTGANVEEVAMPPAPTKEFYVRSHCGTTETNLSAIGHYAAVASVAFHAFFLPHDFSSLVSANCFTWNGDTETLAITMESHYAAVGEAYNANEETGDPNTSFTANRITLIDISSILTGIAAGDYIGIEVARAGVSFMGIRFRYT